MSLSCQYFGQKLSGSPGWFLPVVSSESVGGGGVEMVRYQPAVLLSSQSTPSPVCRLDKGPACIEVSGDDHILRGHPAHGPLVYISQTVDLLEGFLQQTTILTSFISRVSAVVSPVYLGLSVNSNDDKMIQSRDNIAGELDNKGLSNEVVLRLIRVNITLHHGHPLRPEHQY